MDGTAALDIPAAVLMGLSAISVSPDADHDTRVEGCASEELHAENTDSAI